MPKSLQDHLRKRRSSTFVGREQQLELFRANLQRAADSEECLFLFSIYGQGGVGKTTLVKKFEELAKQHMALIAYANEDIKDVPDLLGAMARQLDQQDASLSKFDKHYKTYLQEKKRLEADPEAPKGIWAFGGRLIAKGGKELTKLLVPGSGLVVDQIDTALVGDQLGEWASFVKKKITNKDEVQLLLEPVETLTPLFLEGLREYAAKPRICFFFDTFEETGRYLDEWIRNLLEGEYGDAPENLLLTISGREPLNPDHWAAFGDAMSVIPLEPFSDSEARSYLERKQITDAATVETILHISGRLPVLLEILAEAAPNTADSVADPCDTAVERFLKWIKDSQQRNLALYGALPRYLNQDVVKSLLPPDADAGTLFQWLRNQPFVSRREDHWAYHGVVRELMLRYLRQVSLETWKGTNEKLAAYYAQQATALGIEEKEAQWRDETWRGYQLECRYHQLLAFPKKAMPEAVRAFATAFCTLRNNALPWSETIYQAGEITKDTEWGATLRKGMAAYFADEWRDALPMFQAILNSGWVEDLGDLVLLWFQEGLWNHRLGDKDKAIECYQKAIDINPNFHVAFYAMGLAFSAKGDQNKAIECYQKAIDIKPDYHVAFNNMGSAYDDLGDKDKAIECYQKAIGIKPDFPEAFYNMGNAFSAKGDKDKAIECFQKAIDIMPDFHVAFNNMGSAFSAKGDQDKAIECYQKAIDIKPDKHEAFNNMGSAYYDLGDKDKAIECYEKAIDIKPDFHVAFYNMGVACNDLGDKDKAIECYQKAIDIKPDYHVAFNNMGSAYDDLGDKDKAIECYQKAIGIKPDKHEAFYNMGSAFSAKGDYDKAIECYQKAIDIQPNYHEAFNNMGSAFSAKGDKDKAIECYDKAIDIMPDFHVAFYNMGSAFSAKGDYDKAIECYDKAIDIMPDFHVAFMAMGSTFSAKGDYDKAIECYDKVIDIKPDDHEAFNNMGSAYDDLGDKDKAIECYQKAIDIKPDDEDAWHSLGWNKLLLHELEEAERALLKSWELCNHQKGNPPMNLGHINLLRGFQEKAMEWYRTSLALWEDKEAFFQGMESDFKDLEMAHHGISRAAYDKMLQKLRQEDTTQGS
jgi:tetratricopeptide (TPR) repeat protein